MNKMRYNILSFSLAAVVASSVLVGAHIAKRSDSGLAYAAPSGGDAAHNTDVRKKRLHKAGFNLSYLVGVNGQDIQSLLKTPSLVRQDLPVTIWQYRSENCVLDVYFKSPSRDVLNTKAVHYELRGRDKAQVINALDCSAQIAKAQGGVRMVDVSSIFKSP